MSSIIAVTISISISCLFKNIVLFIVFSFFMFERMMFRQAKIISSRQDPQKRESIDRIKRNMRHRLSFVCLYELFDSVDDSHLQLKERIIELENQQIGNKQEAADLQAQLDHLQQEL